MVLSCNSQNTTQDKNLKELEKGLGASLDYQGIARKRIHVSGLNG